MHAALRSHLHACLSLARDRSPDIVQTRSSLQLCTVLDETKEVMPDSVRHG
jgi:hypothetical protein